MSSCSLLEGGAKLVADALMSRVRDVVSRQGRDVDREKGLAERARDRLQERGGRGR